MNGGGRALSARKRRSQSYHSTMATTPDNLRTLHQEEESIRVASLAAITADEALSDHLQAVHDALDHLTNLLQVESTPGSDSHTLQLLVIRLFNTGASALKLGLSGYYQTAFQLLRDSLELVNLVDLFRADPAIVAQWKAADDKKLKKDFSPAAVRTALAAFPQYAGQDRKKLYALFSGHAAHMAYKGFHLVALRNSPTLGPFFESKLLRALLEDLGKHMSHATIALSTMFEKGKLPVLMAKAAYIDGLGKYHQKYIKQ